MATDKRPLTVIVFARRPKTGAVKRRLALRIGGHRAASIYADTLGRTLDTVSAMPGCRRLVMTAGANDVDWFRQRYGRRGWRSRAQTPGDLGRRMSRALTFALRQSQHVILIGSDLADCVVDDLKSAARHLQAGDDIVLGPAVDGGYWLIGMTAPQPELFRQLPWSSASIYRDTCKRAAELGLSVRSVAARHDVDRVSDLRWLKNWQVQRSLARSRSSRAA